MSLLAEVSRREGQAAPLGCIRLFAPGLHSRKLTHPNLAFPQNHILFSVIERLVAEFGADHVMWGSDFCQIHDRNYDQLVALAKSAFSSLSSEDQSWCFARTAMSLWPSLAAREA